MSITANAKRNMHLPSMTNLQHSHMCKMFGKGASASWLGTYKACVKHFHLLSCMMQTWRIGIELLHLPPATLLEACMKLALNTELRHPVSTAILAPQTVAITSPSLLCTVGHVTLHGSTHCCRFRCRTVNTDCTKHMQTLVKSNLQLVPSFGSHTPWLG